MRASAKLIMHGRLAEKVCKLVGNGKEIDLRPTVIVAASVLVAVLTDEHMQFSLLEGFLDSCGWQIPIASSKPRSATPMDVAKEFAEQFHHSANVALRVTVAVQGVDVKFDARSDSPCCP